MTQKAKRQFLADDDLILEKFLLTKIRKQLALPNKYSDEIIKLNLLFLFINDDISAIKWIDFIEHFFKITIPDVETDYFFFSNITCMIETISKYKSTIDINKDILKVS